MSKGFHHIDDMFEIRLALEGLAIQLAIDRMDEIHLVKIKDVFELMEFYTGKKEQEKINDLNILYHETIYQATQSQYFEQLLKDVHYYVSVTSRHSITQPERLETALKEHKAILDAIIANDKELAKETIQKLKFWLENTIQIKVNKKGSIWSNDQIESLLCIHNEYIERYLSLINNPGMVYNC